MLSLHYKPELSWTGSRTKAPRRNDVMELLLSASHDESDSLHIYSLHSELISKQYQTFDRSPCMRRYKAAPQTPLRAKFKREAVKLNELMALAAEKRLEKQSPPSPKLALHRKSAAVLLRFKSVRKCPHVPLSIQPDANGLLVTNCLGQSRSRPQFAGPLQLVQSTKSKGACGRIDFRGLAAKRETLLKISSACEKRCHTSHQLAKPVLYVSQVRVPVPPPRKEFRRVRVACRKKAVPAENKNVETEGGEEAEMKKNAFRPITSGAIVIKTRAGKTLDVSCV